MVMPVLVQGLARNTQIQNGQENYCTGRGWKASSEHDVDADKHRRAAHTRSQQSLRQADNETFDTYKVDRSGLSPHNGGSSFEEGYLNSSMAAITTALPRPLLERRATATTSVDVQCMAKNQLEGLEFRARDLRANTARNEQVWMPTLKGNRVCVSSCKECETLTQPCQRIAQQHTLIISKRVIKPA